MISRAEYKCTPGRLWPADLDFDTCALEGTVTGNPYRLFWMIMSPSTVYCHGFGFSLSRLFTRLFATTTIILHSSSFFTALK